jgi:hypothetical protein
MWQSMHVSKYQTSLIKLSANKLFQNTKSYYGENAQEQNSGPFVLSQIQAQCA